MFEVIHPCQCDDVMKSSAEIEKGPNFSHLQRMSIIWAQPHDTILVPRTTRKRRTAYRTCLP